MMVVQGFRHEGDVCTDDLGAVAVAVGDRAHESGHEGELPAEYVVDY